MPSPSEPSTCTTGCTPATDGVAPVETPVYLGFDGSGRCVPVAAPIDPSFLWPPSSPLLNPIADWERKNHRELYLESVTPGELGLVYLAGPMRGIAEFNFPAFHEGEKVLREAGWGVFNPASMDVAGGFDAVGLDGSEDLSLLGFSLREALGSDLEFITQRADAVAVLPGWESSKGARAEVATALALGLPVFEALLGQQVKITHLDTSVIEIGDHTVLRGDGEASKVLGKETRVTSATGGQKGQKAEQYQSIPVGPMRELAKHFARGAIKYSDHNFRRGFPWSSAFSAGQRHSWDFWGGNDYDVCSNDPEGCSFVTIDGEPFTPTDPDTCYNHTGSKHVIAWAWQALCLASFMDEHPEFDDRYVPAQGGQA